MAEKPRLATRSVTLLGTMAMGAGRLAAAHFAVDGAERREVEVVHVRVGEEDGVDGREVLTRTPGRRWRRSRMSRVAKTGSISSVRPAVWMRNDEWPMKVIAVSPGAAMGG